MNQWLARLEKKIGKYAIKHLIVYLILGYVIGYILYFANPRVLSYLTLEPYFILKGQIWRLVTWILVPPSGGVSGLGLLFAGIMMLFYYQLGRILEQTWGAFRFNVYMFGGMIFTILGAFLLHLINFMISGEAYLAMFENFQMYADAGYYVGIGYMFSTSYINESIFLAFAVMYPDMRVMLYFIIPIRMKWMAIFYGVLILVDVIRSDWGGKVAIIASLLNFLIFFLSTRKLPKRNPNQNRARQPFRPGQEPRFSGGAGGRPTQPPPRPVARHRCAVCGRTDETNPELEFRFCSRCNGNYEYCQDHLFTHTHVQ